MRRGAIPLICDPLPEFIVLGGVRAAVESDFRRWIMVLQVLEEEISPSDKAEVIMRIAVKDGGALEEAERRLGERFTDELFAAAVEFLSCGKVKRRGGGFYGDGIGKGGAAGEAGVREKDGGSGEFRLHEAVVHGKSVGSGEFGLCEKDGGSGEFRLREKSVGAGEAGVCGSGKPGGFLKEREFDFAFDSELIFASFYEAYGIDLDVVRLHWWKFCALLSALPDSTVLMRVVSLRRADLGSIADDDLRKKVRRAKAAVRIRE